MRLRRWGRASEIGNDDSLIVGKRRIELDGNHEDLKVICCTEIQTQSIRFNIERGIHDLIDIKGIVERRLKNGS